MRVENWHPEVITAEIEKTAMDRLEKAGELVAAKARAKVPVGTITRPRRGAPWTERRPGTLRDSIRVRRLKDDPKLNIWVIGGSIRSHTKLTAYYAHMVEFGTVNMPANPFMRPALNEARASIMTIMENG